MDFRQNLVIYHNPQGQAINATVFNESGFLNLGTYHDSNDWIIADERGTFEIRASRLNTGIGAIGEYALSESQSAFVFYLRVYFDADGICGVGYRPFNTQQSIAGVPSAVYEDADLRIPKTEVPNDGKNYVIAIIKNGDTISYVWVKHTTVGDNDYYYYGCHSANWVGGDYTQFTVNKLIRFANLIGFVAAYIPFSQGVQYELDTTVRKQIHDLSTLFVSR